MPRYYCDYCDMYLSHDSAGGRKEHIRGWKHRENVMAYFKPLLGTFLQSGQGNAWQGWQQSLRGGQGAPPIPVGWEQRIAGEGLSKFEKNRPYYVHLESGRSTWTHPALLEPSVTDGVFEKPWEEQRCMPVQEGRPAHPMQTATPDLAMQSYPHQFRR